MSIVVKMNALWLGFTMICIGESVGDSMWPDSLLGVAHDLLPGNVTLEVDVSSWRRHYFSSGHATLARGEDGSSVWHYFARKASLFGLFRHIREVYGLTLPDGTKIFLNSEGEGTRSRGNPLARRIPSYDENCEKSLDKYDLGPIKTSRPGIVAGHRVVIREGEERSQYVSIVFAPDLGCTILSARFMEKGYLGIPVEAASYAVTSIQRGPLTHAYLSCLRDQRLSTDSEQSWEQAGASGCLRFRDVHHWFGFAMLWCCSCSWPQRIQALAELSLPEGTTIHADVTHWRLDKFDAGQVTLASGSDGPAVSRYDARRSLLVTWLGRRKDEYSAALPGVLPPRPIPAAPHDPECKGAWTQIASDETLATRTGVIAGYRVVVREGPQGTESVSMALAPDLKCTILRATTFARGRFGIPVEAGSWEVTSVRRGPIDPRLLIPPSGYKVADE